MFRHTRTVLSLTAALAAGGSVATAGTAAAQPVGNGGGSRGCAVEDEHGNVTYVPTGSRYLLWHCGADGEWHFGWLVDSVRAVKPGKHVIPPRAAATTASARTSASSGASASAGAPGTAR